MARFSDWLRTYNGSSLEFSRLAATAARDPGWPAGAGYAALRRYLVANGASDTALGDLAAAFLAYPGDPPSGGRAADDGDDRAVWEWYAAEEGL